MNNQEPLTLNLHYRQHRPHWLYLYPDAKYNRMVGNEKYQIRRV